MADRVKDKIKPITSFSINFPLTFTVADTQSNKEKLKKKFGSGGRIRNVSRFLKRDFLNDFFSVKNELELLKKNELIHKKVNEVKDELIEEAGIGRKEFPEWSKKKIEEYLKEDYGEK